MYNQLSLPLNHSTSEEGKVLDPQPPRFSDCITDYKNHGYFGFWTGNSMEGHECTMTVQTKDLTLEPFLDNVTEKWVWKKK